MEHELHDRLDDLMRDPYPHYARARAAQGLVRVPELDAWLVARDADVREVLRRTADFSSAGALRPDVMPAPAALAVLGGGFGGRPVVVTSDGERHQRLRAPLVRALSPARVAAAVPYARERAAALVDGFVADGGVELMSAYATRLPGEVIGRIVGLDPADVPLVVHGGRRAEELLFRPLPEAGQIAAAEDVVAMQHVLDRCARDRYTHPREDLATEIVASVSEPGHPELPLEQRHEAVAHLQNLLIAGHLTTTALIGTTVLHLLGHRRQWELLRERPDLIPAAVEEAARYDGALQGFRRTTTRPVTLAGTELPAGADLFVAFGAANRDASCHPRPDTFDITRDTPARHLAFGFGAHACVGAQLAREQLRVTVGELTRRLPDLRLAAERPVTMRPTMIHRSPEELHLTW
ncbi:cytochrome P450 [Streptomyces fuscichromogenes]|uniref:cytochrome P450 n=1 Tax=Streptomyces fuscichromogenes TaxID=1324013 RepID=UPI001671389D|nr:cytochrome P450 [Streptomyces fuscichromogenes]